MPADLERLRLDVRATSARHAALPDMVRGQNVPYQRRGEMSIPAFRMKAGGHPQREGREQSLRMMKKAESLPVDFFFFDLEDAAPEQPEFKAHARRFCVEALTSMDFGTRVVAFRPNNIRTPFFEEDLITVLSGAGHRLAALVLPKTETAAEVEDVCRLVRDIQRACGNSNRIMVEVLIESPRAVTQAAAMAALPDVAALILGPYDLARTLGSRVEPDTWLEDQRAVRQLLPVWAAAHGKDAVDGITGTLPVRPATPAGMDDGAFRALLKGPADALDATLRPAVERYQQALALARRDALDARRCGFAAKWILHPDQVEPIQAAFTPSRADALAALQLAAEYAAAAQRGSGAELRAGGGLVDKAVVGADFWLVEGGLRAGVLTQEDLGKTGFTLDALRRSVRTRD